MKVIRLGHHAKVGDLIRNGWCTETRSIQPPYVYGIVIKTETRRLGPYTQEQIDEKPIRLIHFLTDDGKMIRRYAVHIEVLSEVDTKELTDAQLETVCGGMSQEGFENWKVGVLNESR